MISFSPLLNILSRDIRNECKSIVRDFGEIEKLQSSITDINNYVDKTEQNIENKIIVILNKIKPNLEIKNENECNQENCWLVDFIDNRLNFSRANENFLICISLKEKNEIQASFFFNPIKDEFYFFQKGLGSYRNDERIRVSNRKKIVESVVNIFKKINQSDDYDGIIFLKSKLSENMVTQRESGSVFLDLCNMASGKSDCCVFVNPSKKLKSISNLITNESGGMIENVKYKDSEIYLAGNKYIEKLVKEMLEINN